MNGNGFIHDDVIIKVVISEVVMIITVFIPDLFLYDCALKLAAHFLSNSARFALLPRATAWLECSWQLLGKSTFAWLALSWGFLRAWFPHLPEQRVLTNWPTTGEQIISDGSEFLEHTLLDRSKSKFHWIGKFLLACNSRESSQLWVECDLGKAWQGGVGCSAATVNPWTHLLLGNSLPEAQTLSTAYI